MPQCFCQIPPIFRNQNNNQFFLARQKPRATRDEKFVAPTARPVEIPPRSRPPKANVDHSNHFRESKRDCGQTCAEKFFNLHFHLLQKYASPTCQQFRETAIQPQSVKNDNRASPHPARCRKKIGAPFVAVRRRSKLIAFAPGPDANFFVK